MRASLSVCLEKLWPLLKIGYLVSCSARVCHIAGSFLQPQNRLAAKLNYNIALTPFCNLGYSAELVVVHVHDAPCEHRPARGAGGLENLLHHTGSTPISGPSLAGPLPRMDSGARQSSLDAPASSLDADFARYCCHVLQQL